MPDDLTRSRALSRRRLLLGSAALSAGALSAGAVAAPLLRPGRTAQAAAEAASVPARHWVGSWTASPTR
jgi:nitrous oxide reductase